MHLNHLSYCFSIDNAHFRVSMLSDGVINFVIPGHSHAKGCYEIHCITDGNGSILLNNTRFPVAAGSIYVTGPHIFHEQTPDHAHPMTEMCVYMQLIASPDQHDDTLFDKHLVQSFLQQTCWIGTDTTGISSNYETNLFRSNYACACRSPSLHVWPVYAAFLSSCSLLSD